MKIAVIGATGATGRQVVLQALDKGWLVNALVRNPQGMDAIQHDNLKVSQCDIFSTDSVSECLTGCESVVSCLGARGVSMWPWAPPVSFYSQSMKHIIAGMHKAGLKRLVVITSSCTKYKPENPWLVEWFLKPVFIGRLLADMSRMEDYLLSEDCVDINYTIVKPNGLSNNDLMDVDLKTNEGEFVPGGAMSIPRANVAKYMLAALEKDTCNRKAIAVAV